MVPMERTCHKDHACQIINTSENMNQVKVFVTDGQTDRRTDGQMKFNVPTLSRKAGDKKTALHYINLELS